ncbi:MAG: hypothetical protein QCI38_02000, partial [Candidatus Thermoplasmatota archaeon]|nr:hypothetical protein [Candidatus Thermoplasmatota archaeon]
MEDIPKGNIAKTHGGGPNSLEPVVDRVKKFGFTGYIRTTHGGSAGTEGFIFFVDGEPRFYIHRKLDGNQETRGPQAMKAINEDAALIDSSIEVHTNIDVMAVLGKLQKQTPVTATTRRSSRRAILAWGKAAETTDEDKRKMLKERLEHIKAEGYEIDVDKLVEGELEDVQAAVSSMEKSFQK